MYDKERIGKIISDIERYFTDLEGMNVKTVKELENKKNFHLKLLILHFSKWSLRDVPHMNMQLTNCNIPHHFSISHQIYDW